jgi:hypothetical protein
MAQNIPVNLCEITTHPTEVQKEDGSWATTAGEILPQLVTELSKAQQRNEKDPVASSRKDQGGRETLLATHLGRDLV